MDFQIDNFKVLVSNLEPLENLIKKKYQLKNFKYQILSKSIDARDKENVYYNYRLKVQTEKFLKGKNIKVYEKEEALITYKDYPFNDRPIIVGFGPAGIFASLYLARCHAKPIIIERGSEIDKRVLDLELFNEKKILNKNSNIQFGEGGAGTFSDGKLTTNLKNPLIKFILEEFYKHGADINITYENMPHIGTDVLREVIKKIREEIKSLGGSFYFDHTFESLEKVNDELVIKANELTFKTKHLILGLGHSAKDTLRYLYDLGLKMETKGFSMGVRIEHLQAKINEAQYGEFHKFLPPAYYKLATHLANGRGVYTFCMCPGGYVMASTSDEKTIVTNGMSNKLRDGLNSNSALLVDIKPSDFENDILKGLAFQEYYEKKAYELAGDYRAPANLVKEFLAGRVATQERSIKTTYPHGLYFCDLKECLPEFVIEGLKEGLNIFDHKLHGFKDDDAILVGIESRSSSPVRILRDQNYLASQEMIYPIGEGAGYAGGITSASLDGLKCAIKIVNEN